MRAVIIGNGTVRDYDKIKSYIKSDDFVICADGGYCHALNMGIRPRAVIGDFDSTSEAEIDAELIRYPGRKDFTDGELCVDYAIKHGAENILLLAMTGTRLDHTINNIMMLTRCGGMVVDEENEIYILRDKVELWGKKGKTLSVIPLCGNLEGISNEGMEYPLHDEVLEFGTCRGNSNVISEDYCSVSIKKGIGIVLINDGK